MEQNILPNTMQIDDLPAELRVRIFKHLNYRDRIHLESVSRTWRTLALESWEDHRILRFSREMLRLDESWKDKKRFNSSSSVDELNSQQNELAQLKAVIRRCAPFLDELHMLGAFDMKMRFGCIFSLRPFDRLAHLHITAQLDSWHLCTIQRHLAPQLLSLAVVPNPQVLYGDGYGFAFQQLLAKCNKLENLQIASIHFGRLFAGHSENNGGSSQSQPSSMAQIESKCSFMPSTLKFLFIEDNAEAKDYENPDHLVNILLSLLANCSQLRYMPVLIRTKFDLFKLIGERNPRELDKIIRLQLPFFIAKSYSFPYIHQRPEFRNLKALHVNFEIGAKKIHQIAKCCPQLEHLGILLSYWDDNHIMEIQDLVALHQFQQLSSLEIVIEFGNYNDFHEMFRPGDGGERDDMDFLAILTKLDQIHPLRSLDFKPLYNWVYPSLSQDYLLEMSKQLKHLETFSCGFYLRNLDIDDETGIGQFCEQLEQIFNSQEGATKKTFKFRLVANAYEWDTYDSRERKNLLVQWRKGCGTKRSKMNWHCMPLTGPKPWHYHFQPARSIVLNELITNQFGQRTSSMLFDSFDTMEENSQ